jgi:hypothetical protein
VNENEFISCNELGQVKRSNEFISCNALG